MDISFSFSEFSNVEVQNPFIVYGFFVFLLFIFFSFGGGGDGGRRVNLRETNRIIYSREETLIKKKRFSADLISQTTSGVRLISRY